jgi:hypothetical protein
VLQAVEAEIENVRKQMGEVQEQLNEALETLQQQVGAGAHCAFWLDDHCYLLEGCGSMWVQGMIARVLLDTPS